MSQDDQLLQDTTANEGATPATPQSKEAITRSLDQFKGIATQQYALKNYTAAAEAYSQAAELQDEINGEMALDNAELLYQYGRCLYHVGVSNSDVLGGKVAQQEEPKRKKQKVSKTTDTPTNGYASSIAKQDDTATSPAQQGAAKTNDAAGASKPFFQISGDENWTDSEEEEEDAADGDEQEEEDDDLAIAYEILDSARVLFERKIDTLQSPDAHDKLEMSKEVRTLKERLADTHDLQAEIKLENEQFKDAVNDAQQALAYKLQLYPQESGLVAEAHYKLSIALDFAALPIQSGEDNKDEAAEAKVDEEMRKQAADEMEKAILSCQARIAKEEASLPALEGLKLDSMKRSIADARDLVKDMRNRLVDLRNPVASAAVQADELNGSAIKGLLGEMLGQSKAEQRKMLSQATESANDLSGLIKQRKKSKFPAAEESQPQDKGKRKLDEDVDVGAGKKLRFQDDV